MPTVLDMLAPYAIVLFVLAIITATVRNSIHRRGLSAVHSRPRYLNLSGATATPNRRRSLSAPHHVHT
jgi:hypothetical protein